MEANLKRCYGHLRALCRCVLQVLFFTHFRGKSYSLALLHSFPEGFRSGRHRKGAEMNHKNTGIDTSTMGGRIRALRLQKGWSQEELVTGRAGIPDWGE